MLIFQCSHWWCLPTLADISLESCSTQLQMIHKQLNEHWTIFTHIALIAKQSTITISCTFLVVGPSSCNLYPVGAILIQFEYSKTMFIQQNFEVNFILREWSSWMMERHFPFPYAAPQIYASPGCNAENSNFNMTERNLISRKFFFPFFLVEQFNMKIYRICHKSSSSHWFFEKSNFDKNIKRICYSKFISRKFFFPL